MYNLSLRLQARNRNNKKKWGRVMWQKKEQKILQVHRRSDAKLSLTRVLQDKRKKKENTHSTNRVQNKIQAYLTKTLPKHKDNTHKQHKTIPQTSTEYCQGTSGENIKTNRNQQTQVKL